MFWCKTISGNNFTPHRVFGCTWKIEFSGKAFHLAVNIMALTRKLFYISIFTSNHFWTQTRRERERKRERRDHWYSPSHKLTHSQRAPPSPSLQMQPILSLMLFRKFPLSLENFSPHSLSSFTPSPSRRTERAIASKTQI